MKLTNTDSINKDQMNVLTSEDRYSNQLEIHKFIISKLSMIINANNNARSLIDIGCGAGELIYFLKKKVKKDLLYTGIDICSDPFQAAIKLMPEVSFKICSVFDEMNSILADEYDYVTMCGVHGFFDELNTPLKNIYNILRNKGFMIVFGPVNEDPIDVVMRYNVSNENTEEWKPGWNIFSKVTFEKILRNIGFRQTEWHDFSMPFNVEKRENNPMRTWTQKIGDRQCFVNGASQIINYKLLIAQKG